MDGAKFIKELSGHSGCILRLYQSQGKGAFVRKVSPTEDYNHRLKAQYLKQRFFSPPTVRTPRVLEHGYLDGKFYFDMEFVMGKTLAESLGTSSIPSIRYLTKIFAHYFRSFSPVRVETNSELFQRKILNLQEIISPSTITDTALGLLRQFCWDHVPQSPCHGDLTLENIIVQQNSTGMTVYVIDFLDSFYDSWLIDIAKLLQDLELGWSFRNSVPDTTRSVRMLIAKEILLAELRQLPDSDSLLLTAYHLTLLNVLRIYPYCHDDNTKKFLNNALKTLLHKLNYL